MEIKLKMPRATDEELNKWKDELDKARKHRRIFMYRWNYYEEIFDDNLWGNHKFEKLSAKSSQNKEDFIPQINEAESIIMSILPQIHFWNPVFEITPHYNDIIDRFSASVYELLADVLYDMLGLSDNISDAIIDTLLLGGGLHKAGYSYHVESTRYQLGDATAGEPEITNDMVFSGYVSPKDVLWDCRVTRWQDKRWFAEEIVKPVEEIKDSVLYSHTRDLKGNLSFTDDIEGIAVKDNKKGDLIRIVEIHNLQESKILTIADGHNKILRKDDDYGLELYDNLTFIPSRPRRFWGKSVLQSIEEHMVAIAKIYAYMLSHSKRAGLTKVGAEPHLLSKEAIRALESSKDFEIVPVDGISQGEPIKEIKFSSVSADWFANFNMVDGVMRLLSGVTQQERGRHEAGVQTAFEVAKLSAASDVRNKHRELMVNKFTSSLMSRLLKIVSDNYVPSRILDMVGLPQEHAWMLIPFDRMRLRIKYGSTAMEARREKLNRVVIFAQLVSAMGMQVNPQGVLELISDALGLELKENMLLMSGSGGGLNEAQQAARSPAVPRSQLGNLGGVGLPQV